MADEPNDTLTQADVLANIDAFVKGNGLDKAGDRSAKGGDDEPESGESESEAKADEADEDEQDEAESESDDEQEEAETDEDEETPKRVRLKVDGTDVEVTFDELKEGYSREADYRRKTQAHAEEVRKFEAAKEETLKAEKTALSAEREQYKQVLGIWEQQLTQALGNDEDLGKLRASDPGEWSAKMTERYELQGRLQRIQAEQAKLVEKDRSARETDFKAKVANEAKLTLEAIPEWKNPATYQEDSRKIFEYAKVVGYAPEEINAAAATDHRIARILKDAAAFRALQDKKPVAVKKVEAAKPLPPGNASPQQSKASSLKKLAQIQSQKGDKNSTVALFAEAFKL